MNWTVPRRVRPGDTVAVVSPSFGAVGAWPHRAERGEAYLESLGLRVKLMPHAAEVDGWVAGRPEARADDIHSAFADPEVTVVLAGIGGNHSNQLLPLLDYDLIRANPKIFEGYSDITVLHYAFLKNAGLATFYGDAFTLGLAEYPKVFDYTDRWLRAAWFRQEPLSDRPDSDGAAPKELRFEAATEWTEEFMDFDQKLDLTRPRTMRPSEGWVTIRDGMAEGPIVGGCLETICWHLKGSNAWIQPAGCIFFFERGSAVTRARRGVPDGPRASWRVRRRGWATGRAPDGIQRRGPRAPVGRRPEGDGAKRHPRSREHRLRTHRSHADAPPRTPGGPGRGRPDTVRAARRLGPGG